MTAVLCTRAIYENIATLCDFADKLKPLCDAVDYDGVETFTRKYALGTRIPSFLERLGDETKAPQILNQVDRMGKRFGGFRESYDHLSDVVHPNGLGALAYFGTIKPGVDFTDAGNHPERARLSLLSAGLLLLHVELALIQIEQWLEKLSADVVARRSVE